MELRVLNRLTEEDRQALAGGETDPFGVGSLNLAWRPKDWHLFAYSEGDPVSHVGLLAVEVQVDDLRVAVAGVGGVITAPAFRGRGLAQRLLREATAFMSKELGADFGFLFCLPRLVPFYEGLGWQRLAPPILVEQPQGEIECPVESMILPLSKRPWPPGKVQTKSLPW